MAGALEGVEGLLLDLSGVIYVQDEAVPGAAEALERLRAAGGPIRLVTNTTMRPRRTILERLERLGIEADPEELITPATLAKRRCEEAGAGLLRTGPRRARHLRGACRDGGR